MSTSVTETTDHAWHTMPAEEVLQVLQVDTISGSTAAKVASRATTYGSNKFAGGQGRAAIRRVDAAATPAHPTHRSSPGAPDLARQRRGHHRCRHPWRDRLVRTRVQLTRRPRHGGWHLLTVHPAVLDRHQGRTTHRVHPRHRLRQDLHQSQRTFDPDPDPGHRARTLAGIPRHGQPQHSTNG